MSARRGIPSWSIRRPIGTVTIASVAVVLGLFYLGQLPIDLLPTIVYPQIRASVSNPGVAPEVMGIGPIKSIPKVLKQVGLTLDDLDLIELNEAFASQSLAIVRTLGLDEERVNVNGGAIALGHPLGCTGAKLTATLLHELARRGGRYGMVTMCIGGGMGASAVFENLRR